jgi:hypothetical protein
MDDLVPFGSRLYVLCFLLLFIARGMDFLSTWIATPNLVLEGNPLAKRLGWRWGIPLNIIVCITLARWPVCAIAISTTSLLVAARNFQYAWLMRSLGEEVYRDWHIRRIQETPVTLYVSCLAGQTVLTAAVGVAIVYFSGDLLTTFSIGIGVIAYAIAVAFYTLLAVWRLRRAVDRPVNGHNRSPGIGSPLPAPGLKQACACGNPEPQDN